VSQLLFDAPSFILAALIAAVVARAIVDWIPTTACPGVLNRVLTAITNPILRPVRAVAPRIVPSGVICLFAVCWLTAARMAWVIVGAALGLRTSFGG